MLWSQPIPPASAPPWSDTFVGREAEWSAFARSIGELANGQPGGTRVFVVYGETGMGKSALLRRYRALAAARLPDDRIISIDLSQQHFTSARALAESIAAAVRARHPGFDATYDSDVRQRQRLADDYARLQREWDSWNFLRALDARELDQLIQSHYRARQQRIERRTLFGAAYNPTHMAAQTERLVDEIYWHLAFCRDNGGRGPASFDEIFEYRYGKTDAELFRSDLPYGRALGRDLDTLAAAAPLVLLIDGYERADQHDDWLHGALLASCGDRVMFVLAGRRTHETSYMRTFGEQWQSRVAFQNLNQPLGPDDVRRYLRARLGLAQPPPDDLVSEIAAASRGVPLALAAAGDQLAAGGPLEPYQAIPPEIAPHERFAQEVVQRFLRQTLGGADAEPALAQRRLRDRQRIRALSLLLRPDPELAAALWGVTPAEAGEIASDLACRYTFAFGSQPAFAMHDAARARVRSDTLAIRGRLVEWEPFEIGLRRAMSVVRERLDRLSQQLPGDDRYGHAEWGRSTLDLLNLQLWLGEWEQAQRLLLNHWIEAQHAGRALASWLFERAVEIAPRNLAWQKLIAALRAQDYDLIAGFEPLLEPRVRAVLCYLRAGRLPVETVNDASASRLDRQIALLKEGYRYDGGWTPVRAALVERLSARGHYLLYQRSDYPAAIADFDMLLELRPDYPTAFSRRGAARQYLGDWQGALADYDQALALRPDDPATLFSRGVVRHELGDVAGALDDLDQALRTNPDDPVALGYRGAARHDGGDLAGAMDDLNQSLDGRPDHAPTLCRRGRIYADQGDLIGAFLDIDRANVLTGGDPDVLRYRGEVAAKSGFYEEALRDLDASLAKRPAHAPTLRLRARVLAELRRLDEALDDLGYAILLDPNEADAYARRGLLREGLAAQAGRQPARQLLQQALADYDQALTLRPGHAATLCRRGAVKARLGELQPAIADLSESIKANASDPVAYAERGRLWQILASRISGLKAARALAEAERDYSHSLRLSQRQPEIWYRRGCVRMQLGNLPDAEDDLTEALNLGHDPAETYFQRGVGRRRSGDLAGARDDFDEALGLRRDRPEVLCEMGGVQAALGNRSEAEAHFADALRLRPDDVDTIARLARLKTQRRDLVGAAPLYAARARHWLRGPSARGQGRGARRQE